jgi:tetratricopeptide (TPR) repeat protein
MELAATRLRLLGPQALLRRIDSALDIASASGRTESRQRTVRDTIAWSYHLLTPPQQQVFRRLGVFAGGAELDAVEAVALGSGARDPLDAVADLVDVSLVAAVEQADGEPRFTMLQTIRAYAREQLRLSGEESAVRARHAQHYLDVARRLDVEHESQHLAALDRAESEHDNFRAALVWALGEGPASSPGSSAQIGLRLCAALGWLWYTGGYATEGLRWYERAVGLAGDRPSRELADCLAGMANLLLAKGRPDPARELADRAVSMARSIGDPETVAFGLSVLGTAEQHSGRSEDARRHLEEAVVLYRELLGPSTRMGHALGNLAGIEAGSGNVESAEQLLIESLATHESLGDSHEATIQRQNLANLLVTVGRPEEALQMATGLVDSVLAFRNPNLTMAFSNTVMNILLLLGRPGPAAHLFGAEQAMRERLEMPNPFELEELEEARQLAQEQMPLAEWEQERLRGQQQTLEDLLSALRPSVESA